MTAAPPGSIRFADLGLRLLSGLGLAAIALVDLWLGGLWVAAMAALVAAGMLWEYYGMVAGPAPRAEPAMLLFVAAGAAAALVTALAGLGWGLALLAAAGALAVALARRRPAWLAAGLAAIGFAACYLVMLRGSEIHGLPTLLWLLLVVIATDVGAYFAGRLIGGRKLWPRVSPGKTWAGSIGGAAIAVAAGLAFALGTGAAPLRTAVLSLAVSVAAQLGDLLESAVKRRYKVKDSGRLIPGHGGLMDRLDGLVGALWFFAIYDALGAQTGG